MQRKQGPLTALCQCDYRQEKNSNGVLVVDGYFFHVIIQLHMV